MTTFVLVPGFWLGAWAWRDVTGALRARGHEVYPVTPTGLADREHLASPEVGLETHIADIVNLLVHEDLWHVVLVAHSGATSPVTGAADRVPERVGRIVYLDTGPMPDGMAQIEFNPPEAQAAIRAKVDGDGEGWKIPVPWFDPAADPVNLAGLGDAHLAAMRERGTPQPFGTAADPLRLSGPPPWERLPHTLICCSFTAAQVKELAAGGNPVFAAMAEPHWDVRELPTGHWPMFSRPADLAGLLLDIAG